ncbi:hypothetical protein HMPREF0880_03375 [Yokenella regensburgei ATCC 43003]|nr:hypothetical protein HMPREF0880_03375 [Yokenella regensburgei ATCC 43003]
MPVTHSEGVFSLSFSVEVSNVGEIIEQSTRGQKPLAAPKSALSGQYLSQKRSEKDGVNLLYEQARKFRRLRCWRNGKSIESARVLEAVWSQAAGRSQIVKSPR